MTYKIESRQKRVSGIGGHNYLALVDENGIVQGEIHGYHGGNGRLVFERGISEPDVEGAAREVVSGAEDEIRRIRSRMNDDSRDLGGDRDIPGSRDNAKAIYGLLSPNSNSFWATILKRSGLTTVTCIQTRRTGLLQPASISTIRCGGRRSSGGPAPSR